MTTSPNPSSGDFMFKVGGGSFRCQCGGNVFHADPDVSEWYVCNSCARTYEATR